MAISQGWEDNDEILWLSSKCTCPLWNKVSCKSTKVAHVGNMWNIYQRLDCVHFPSSISIKKEQRMTPSPRFVPKLLHHRLISTACIVMLVYPVVSCGSTLQRRSRCMRSTSIIWGWTCKPESFLWSQTKRDVQKVNELQHLFWRKIILLKQSRTLKTVKYMCVQLY